MARRRPDKPDETLAHAVPRAVWVPLALIFGAVLLVGFLTKM